MTDSEAESPGSTLEESSNRESANEETVGTGSYIAVSCTVLTILLTAIAALILYFLRN